MFSLHLSHRVSDEDAQIGRRLTTIFSEIIQLRNPRGGMLGYKIKLQKPCHSRQPCQGNPTWKYAEIMEASGCTINFQHRHCGCLKLHQETCQSRMLMLQAEFDKDCIIFQDRFISNQM